MLGEIEHITPEELHEIIQSDSDALVFHIFNVKKFEAEHIPHSISLPAKNMELLQELVPDKYRQIILYDQGDESDNLSVAVHKLNEMKYTNLAILKNGLEAWKEAGYKLHGKEHMDMDMDN